MTVRRIVAGFLLLMAVGLLGVGVFCLLDAARCHREYWVKPLAHECVLFEADLSQPGLYEGEFEHICKAPHGGMLLVKTDEPYATWNDAERALRGSEVFISYMGEDGSWDEPYEVYVRPRLESTGDRWRAGLHREDCFVMNDPGTYRIRVDVRQGAAGLPSGSPPVVWCYYLCGCEKLPSLILNVFGGGTLVLGGILALVGCYCWRRGRVRPTGEPGGTEGQVSE